MSPLCFSLFPSLPTFLCNPTEISAPLQCSFWWVSCLSPAFHTGLSLSHPTPTPPFHG